MMYKRKLIKKKLQRKGIIKSTIACQTLYRCLKSHTQTCAVHLLPAVSKLSTPDLRASDLSFHPQPAEFCPPGKHTDCHRLKTRGGWNGWHQLIHSSAVFCWVTRHFATWHKHLPRHMGHDNPLCVQMPHPHDVPTRQCEQTVWKWPEENPTGLRTSRTGIWLAKGDKNSLSADAIRGV